MAITLEQITLDGDRMLRSVKDRSKLALLETPGKIVCQSFSDGKVFIDSEPHRTHRQKRLYIKGRNGAPGAEKPAAYRVIDDKALRSALEGAVALRLFQH